MVLVVLVLRRFVRNEVGANVVVVELVLYRGVRSVLVEYLVGILDLLPSLTA